MSALSCSVTAGHALTGIVVEAVVVLSLAVRVTVSARSTGKKVRLNVAAEAPAATTSDGGGTTATGSLLVR